MVSLTAHCLIKNEDRFVGYAIRSIINFVDRVLVFDTGSTDGTIDIIKQLQSRYPNKIIFEEKGECDKKRHTKLRQEMIERTDTSWFMILDGDEVWPEAAIQEAVNKAVQNPAAECLIAPFYLCVGDIYHQSKKGQYVLRGKKAHATPRFFRKTSGMHWQGEYNQDAIVDAGGVKVFEKENVFWLQQAFWHLTHLARSSSGGGEFSSGSNRQDKRRLTYFIIGKKIEAPLPEVFLQNPQPEYIQPLSFGVSVKNFFILMIKNSFFK